MAWADSLDELVEKGKLSRSTIKKAISIYLRGRVQLEKNAGQGIYFSVSSSSSHQVIYRPRSGKWMCDCRWSSLHPSKFCSHIIAAQIFLDHSRKEV